MSLYDNIILHIIRIVYSFQEVPAALALKLTFTSCLLVYALVSTLLTDFLGIGSLPLRVAQCSLSQLENTVQICASVVQNKHIK